jgi:hypothetical protein
VSSELKETLFMASVELQGVQALIDLARENARVSKPVTVAQVVDYTFVEKGEEGARHQR